MNTTQPGARAQAASEAAHADAGRAAPRRIDCEPEKASAPEKAAPARGGGVRDPQEWRQLRSARG
ncbi:MAG TPA: hypothetical protein VF092_24075 [Longimicrobium sp.]